MKTYAQYISRIEIESLWSGRGHIAWQLQPGVNVLSGRNGAGKSTILSRVVQHLEALAPSGQMGHQPQAGITLEWEPQEAVCVRYDIVRSIDRQLFPAERVATLGEAQLKTELDWQLYELQRRYLDYQVNVGNRMIALLTSGVPEARQAAEAAAEVKQLFLDLVDELFAETGKRIDRESNELRFWQYGERLSPYVLSSGEKQMLIILLTALTQDRQPTVFFMDEPEVSLHFDWQRRLIAMVLELNPRAQIILTTHSPALIMDGWEDRVTEVSEITLTP